MERETIQTERGRCGSGQQHKWTCLPSFYMDPLTTYISGAGNTFSDVILISSQKWLKGGDDEESET